MLLLEVREYHSAFSSYSKVLKYRLRKLEKSFCLGSDFFLKLAEVVILRQGMVKPHDRIVISDPARISPLVLACEMNLWHLFFTSVSKLRSYVQSDASREYPPNQPKPLVARADVQTDPAHFLFWTAGHEDFAFASPVYVRPIHDLRLFIPIDPHGSPNTPRYALC